MSDPVPADSPTVAKPGPETDIGPEPPHESPRAPRQRGAAKKAPPRPERTIEVLHGVHLNVQVILGEISVPLRDLLSFEVGQVISLDRPAGSPAEVIVNSKPMFKGEIVVVEDEYAVRITEVLSSEASA
jgi:flagellar motor switch protein FliN/FliY